MRAASRRESRPPPRRSALRASARSRRSRGCSRTPRSTPPSRRTPRRPRWSSVTAAPTSSTRPANSVPRLVRRGRRMPVNTRVKRYSALRTPMASPRVTVEACTRTSTSSSPGTGRSTSPIRSTSGGPYRSWMTALISSRPLVDSGACDGSACRASRRRRRDRAQRAVRRRARVAPCVRSGRPIRPR